MPGPDGRGWENRSPYGGRGPPARIVYRHVGGEEVEPVQFHTTITFAEEGGGTRITMCGVFPTAAERDRVAREYGAVEGAQQTIRRLADYVGAL